uniref:GDT1 family protein n=1 Tax=Heterosigma akashiwo TaxID=2829 RepID=A0A7S3UU97_HETAK
MASRVVFLVALLLATFQLFIDATGTSGSESLPGDAQTDTLEHLGEALHDDLQSGAVADAASLKFMPAFVKSVLMIVATELGDKTFFIAAILAMRHSRFLIFGGAIGALALMTVLSTLMGFALPSLIPRTYTHYASALLFLYFGVRLLKDGAGMEGGGPSEELAEVEEELSSNKKGEDEESGGGGSSSPTHVGKRTNCQIAAQAFTLTFLAEWGDRSQIATIALAAAKDPYGVTAGGCIGHALCTGLAVVGGRMLAARISEKTVHLTGGALFLLFAAHSLFFEE